MLAGAPHVVDSIVESFLFPVMSIRLAVFAVETVRGLVLGSSKMIKHVEAIFVVNGTTKTRRFTCESSSVTMAGVASDHVTVIEFVDGRDERTGRAVGTLMLRNAEVVERWSSD